MNFIITIIIYYIACFNTLLVVTRMSYLVSCYIVTNCVQIYTLTIQVYACASDGIVTGKQTCTL